MTELKQKKLTKLVGLNKSDFNEYVRSGDISLAEPRLIPLYKLGDEMALTSVLLSAIKLVKEFRNAIFSEAKLQKGGTVYFYTEVSFKEFKDSRIDGLILIVKNRKITDAAILEVKNGAGKLEKEQLERYQDVARQYAIPKFITISNEFVSDSTQSPLKIRSLKSVEMRHYSWTYLLTLAHVLLFKTNISIQDEDQIEIMREVVNYFEHDKSGVVGINQMGPSWKQAIDKITRGENLKHSDELVYNASRNWHQEEMDMALMLSRELGVLVKSGDSRYKGNLEERIKNDCKTMLSDKRLSSTFKIKDAASDISVAALLDMKTIEMSVSLKAPQDKTLKGQLSWLRKQIEKAAKKDQELFNRISGEIYFDVSIKSARSKERFSIVEFEKAAESLKGRELREFNIVFIKQLGVRFTSARKFVEELESMLTDFYRSIVQHLVKWEPPAPKISRERTSQSEAIDDSSA